MHKLELIIKKEEIVLSLKSGRKVVDTVLWNDETNLSEKLLVEIDKLLKKNDVRREEVKRMAIKNAIPSGYSTVRIAKTVANAWNYAADNQ